MLRHRRNECIELIAWRTLNERDNVPDGIRTLECWYYDGVEAKDQPIRRLDLCDTTKYPEERTEWQAAFHQRLESWLSRKGDNEVLKPSTARGVQGGLRLLMFERRVMESSMTLTRDAFETIESHFGLHDATLPAFLDHGGSFLFQTRKYQDGRVAQIQLVIKLRHLLPVGGCLFSLNYNVESKWTDAFICGDGVVRDRWYDSTHGNQGKQLLAALTESRRDLWMDPMLLPVCILQIYSTRLQTRAFILEKRLLEMETELGVTFTGLAGDYSRDRSEWPMDIDLRGATRELHSLLPRVLFMTGQGIYLSRYAKWLIEVQRDMHIAVPDCHVGADEIRSVIHFLASSVDGMLEFHEGMKGRTESQIDLLFNIVGQRDAFESHKANVLNLEVARSTKEDSISMSTFTFITALYLPLSFVATLFSMTIFNW